jgi:hypothetical protein
MHKKSPYNTWRRFIILMSTFTVINNRIRNEKLMLPFALKDNKIWWKEPSLNWAPVAHACNPRSGGWQFKPAWA